MKGGKIRISNTYIPGLSTEFKLSTWKEEMKTNQDEKEEQKVGAQQGLLKFGISNGWKKNRQYEHLLIDTEIGLRSSPELLTLYFESSGDSPKSKSIHNFRCFRYSKWIQNIGQEKKELVISWFENKWSIK